MHNTEHSPNFPRLVFLDHSGLPGGGQLGLARYLLKTRHDDVHVILLSPGPAFDVVHEKRGIPIKTLGEQGVGIDLVTTRTALRQRLEKIGADVVIANSNKSALLLATIRRSHGSKRRIYYMRDDLNPARKSFLKRVLLGRWMMPRYDLIIANSKWTATNIPLKKLRRRSRISYPVSGITEPTPIDRDFSAGRPLHVLSLSRIAHWKGIHVLLRAAQILESRGLGADFVYTVAGTSTHEDPLYEKQMWTLAGEIGSEIHFPGHITVTEPLLRSHDVLVAASTSSEPFGQVIIQGLSAGLATIASNEGGPVELVEDGVNGYLVEPGNPTQIADVLQMLQKDSCARQRISTAATQSAGRFTDTRTVEMLDNLLEGTLRI